MIAPIIKHSRNGKTQNEKLFQDWVHQTSEVFKRPTTSLSFDSKLTLQMLAYCGLKSEIDLKNFLQSTGGKGLQSKIIELLIQKAAINQELMNAERIQLLLKRAVIASILFSKLERSEAYAHRMQEYLEVMDEKEKRKEAQQHQSTQNTSIEQNTALLASIESIEKAEQALSERFEQHELLEMRLEQLDLKLAQSTERYDLYDEQLNAIPLVIETEPEQRDQQIKNIKDKIEAIKLQLNSNFDKIEDLLSSKEKNPTREKENEDLARALMTRSNSEQLQIEALMDMLAVIQGEKILYTASGERTDYFEKAEYILGKNEKILVELNPDGKSQYHIVPQSIHSIVELIHGLEKEDAQRVQTKAAKAFEKRAPDIMVMKQMVHRNRALEHQEFSNKRNGIATQLKENQTAIVDLTHQLVSLQEQFVKDHEALNPTKSPSPKPVSSKKREEEEEEEEKLFNPRPFRNRLVPPGA